MPIIQTKNLSKHFGTVKAVNNLNLTIQEGEIYGLLGPNGCGKTTTIKMLCGLLKPTSGSATVFEFDSMSRKFQQDIGYMPQETALYPDLTVHDNLTIFGKIFGLSNSELARNEKELLDFINLHEKRDVPITDLSGGMRHRVSLICSMIHKPKILFLDEPTVGVDPELRLNFWKNFNELGKTGTTIIITTHYMDEASHCTKIGLMRSGDLITEGTPADILAKTNTRSLEDAFLAFTAREVA
ncbi:MAG: ABC transporter ATP-binding protein [Thermoplasmata archaeon]|nr:MAG: ABC transporter ATP-binding protein [Thermoplasmata archaeon]